MQQQTVLVIDDDVDIQWVVRANLELHNFNVLTSGTWAEAKEILNANKPDIIVLDVMLPDANGIKVCSEIRQDGIDIPIIMLTAMDKLSDKVIGLQSGADDYIVKPFETLELIARIHTCLRRYQKTQPPLTKQAFADIVIDFENKVVTKKGVEVKLTPKEYSILCILALKKGGVVSREELKAHLWNKTKLYSWSRVIDVHIQHLRQKLEDNPAEPKHILTIPGMGYRLV